jgi:equilibrative nucleoside transporter 1/2/3
MVRFSHFLPYRIRVLGGFTLYTLAILGIPLVAEFIEDRNQSYILAMVLMIIIGVSNAILSSSVFAIGALFPPKYSQAIMAGNGWSGLVVCAIRIFTKAIFNTDDAGYSKSAYMFFGSSSLVCMACIFAYIFVTNSKFSSHYYKESSVPSKSSESENLLSDDTEIQDDDQPSLLSVFFQAWPMLINILMVFVMTFLVFPGTLFAHSSKISFISQSWWGVTAITVFNVFDLIARSLPAYFILVGPKNLPIAVFARFLLYPFFIFLGPAHILDNTWMFLLVIAVFALSNGYFSTLCFIHSGSYVTKDSQRPLLGGLMSVFLTLGIFSGSMISNIIQSVAFD